MDRFFLDFVKRNKARFACMVLGLFASVAVTVPLPLLTRFVIDDVLVAGNADGIVPVVAAFFFVVVVQLLLGRLNAFLASSFSQDFVNETRSQCVRRSMGIPCPEAADDGRLLMVISSDIPSSCQISLSMVSTIVTSFAGIVFYSIMLFALNGFLAAVSLCIMPFFALWNWHIGKRMEILNREAQLIGEELLSSASSVALNRETIASLRFSDKIQGKFDAVAKKVGSFNKKVALYSNFAGSVSVSITSIACFVPFVVGAYYVVEGSMSIGSLVVFNAYCSMLMAPVSSLVGLIAKRRLSAVHEERIGWFLGKVGERAEDQDALQEPFVCSGVELRDFVLFSADKTLIRIDRLDLKKGSVVQLKGPNGSGKTLFLKALAGLYLGYSGYVFVDGNLQRKKGSLEGSSVMYVSSEQPFLLGTIDEELSARCRLDSERYCDLAKDLGVLSFLNESNKPSSEHLARASAGALQRLRIMRALVQCPEYLLLDEVLSNIDSSCPKKLLRAIKKHFPKITIVVVEHHLELGDVVQETYEIFEGGLLDCGAFRDSCSAE